jgi:nicotinamidase-related amidase
MDTAVLIIDVQRALCSGDFEAFESRRVIDRINHVVRLARSAGAPVVIIQHEEQGGPLEFGSDGWMLDPDLDALPSDIRVRKTAPDSFHNTELQAVLQGRKIRKLVICGLQSEFCVDTTTRRALALGYPVTLVADGHTTMDNSVLSARQISAHHNETLSRIDSFGPRVQAIPASDVRIET